MKVYSDTNTYTSKNTVVTLGMFDGVHLGHQQLLASVVNKAKEINTKSVVITFWPHPRIVLANKAEELRFISTLDEKIKLLESQGVDELILLPFTLELSKLSAKDFINDVLIQKFGMSHLVMGYNHRFGKDRVDDYSVYQQIAKEYNFGISKVNAFSLNNIDVSSTVIRTEIELGNVAIANQLLGYSLSMLGKVVGGHQLGRTIGFPTANIQLNDAHKIVPKLGVYACHVLIKGHTYSGMLNIGYRPTVASKESQTTIEVHIFDFDNDIYNEEVELQFIDRVRDEQKFNSVDELQAQLKKDEQLVRNILVK